MRIAIVYDAIYPYVSGGAERRYDALARRLVARGHEVRLIGWKYWSGPTIIETGDGVTLQGVATPVALHDASGRRTSREALAFAMHCARALAGVDADVIECSSIPYLPALFATPIARVRRIPLAVSWHEYMGRRWQTYGGGIASLGAPVERATALVGNLRIAVSGFTRDRLPAGPRTIVINNGIDLRLIKSTPAQPSPDVVLVGRLVPHKRAGLLLEALTFAPGVTAAIIGDGPERQRLESQARALKVHDRISFFGRVPSDARVISMVKGAKCALITSAQEGFAMTALEAMAAGVPPVIVASEHSAASELVTPAMNGVITTDDPREIGSAIESLAHDRALRERLGTNAAAASRAYDWELITDQTERAFEGLIASRLAVPLSTEDHREQAA